MAERIAAPRASSSSNDAPEGREVGLRNDSPGIRIVHDVDGVAQSFTPGEARTVTLAQKVIDILEKDHEVELAKGNVKILRIVSKKEVRDVEEGKGPPPNVQRSTEGNAAAKLADSATEIDWTEFREQSRGLLGDSYPAGSPSRDDIVSALRKHAAKSSGVA